MKNTLMASMILMSGAQFVLAEFPAPIPKTGQSVSYRTRDDGGLQTGVAWPTPRFTVITTGAAQTVLDNLTGLEWVKAPHSLSGNSGATNWNVAVDFCNNLVYAGPSSWRLPSRKELMSLMDYGQYSPALPAGHPFAGVQSYYWSGTSVAGYTAGAWSADMAGGDEFNFDKASYYYVWPVRGGQ